MLVAHGPSVRPAPHTTRVGERRGGSQAGFAMNKKLLFKRTRCVNSHQTGREALPHMRPANAFVLENAVPGECRRERERVPTAGKAFVGSTAELLTRLDSSTRNAGTAGLAAPSGGPESPHSVPAPCPCSLSLFCVPVPHPGSVSLSCVPTHSPSQLHLPALHPCPLSLSCVPAPCPSPAGMGDSNCYCRAEIRVPAPCAILDKAVPCQAVPGAHRHSQGSGCRLEEPQVGPEPSRHRREGSRSQFTCKCPY